MHLGNPGGDGSNLSGGPGCPDQGLDWLPYLLEALLPPGCGPVLVDSLLLYDDDDISKGCFKNTNGSIDRVLLALPNRQLQCCLSLGEHC